MVFTRRILPLFLSPLFLDRRHNTVFTEGEAMLDTIVLTLNRHMYHISDPEAFAPSAKWALENGPKAHRLIQSKQNPTQKELRKGIYKPRLTLAHRMNQFGVSEIMLKIELSLPKLMFGNNFAELRFKDFGTVNTKLATMLQTMGIVVMPEVLAQAPVAAIHYSKNIRLTDGSIPYHYLTKIKQANIKRSLDVNHIEYRNDGHSYRWHCNSYEVVFYDKIRDLEQARVSRRRAIEKDSTLQMHLFEKFKKRHMLEFLRIEVHLNRRQKIKHLFAKLKIRSELTFKKLFKPALSKKILLHYLNELESRRPPLLDYKSATDKGLLTTLIVLNPTMSPKQILQLYGLKMALQVANPRELRTMFAKCSERSWYRLMADANKVRLPMTSSPFKVIREQLERFNMIRL